MRTLQRALRLVLNLPFMVRAFSRLPDATNSRNWVQVAEILEALHNRGLGSDDTHHRLGCAYVMLERWQEACSEFEQIRRSLPNERDESRRLFNYSLALCCSSRQKEAIGVIDAVSGEWPVHMRKKVEQLRQHLREGNVPPPSVQ